MQQKYYFLKSGPVLYEIDDRLGLITAQIGLCFRLTLSFIRPVSLFAWLNVYLHKQELTVQLLAYNVACIVSSNKQQHRCVNR